MGAKGEKVTQNLPRILELLNQSLQLEYSLIIHYPRLASAIRDEDTRNLALELGKASISHADTVANAIIKLGGNPKWSFESLPAEDSIIDIFQGQLEKEKTALRLHQETAALVHDSSLKEKFNELARQERGHISIVENILSKLAQHSSAGGGAGED